MGVAVRTAIVAAQRRPRLGLQRGAPPHYLEIPPSTGTNDRCSVLADSASACCQGTTSPGRCLLLGAKAGPKMKSTVACKNGRCCAGSCLPGSQLFPSRHLLPGNSGMRAAAITLSLGLGDRQPSSTLAALSSRRLANAAGSLIPLRRSGAAEALTMRCRTLFHHDDLHRQRYSRARRLSATMAVAGDHDPQQSTFPAAPTSRPLPTPPASISTAVPRSTLNSTTTPFNITTTGTGRGIRVIAAAGTGCSDALPTPAISRSGGYQRQRRILVAAASPSRPPAILLQQVAIGVRRHLCSGRSAWARSCVTHTGGNITAARLQGVLCPNPPVAA